MTEIPRRSLRREDKEAMSPTLPVLSPPASPSLHTGAPFPGAIDRPDEVRRRRRGVRQRRFVGGWAFGWAAVGALVAAGIGFSRGVADFLPILVLSVLFAEVVGFTSLTSARLVFPFYQKLPLFARFALQVLTLFSGTVFGSVAILATQPLFSLARPKTVAMIVLLNAVFAVIVGIALHTYDSMRRQIEQSYRTLREKEALDREVAIARDVQRELLPRCAPQLLGLELAGACLPAVGVGGDYYDYLTLSQDRVGLVIADVSGKGIPAALLMAGLQASVRSLALPGASPCEINRRLNDMLLQSTSDSRYATLFFGLFDGASGRLTYSNAGHFPPVVLCAGGPVRLSCGGLPIGMFGGAGYEEGALDLKPGDLVALFTDGVVEAPDPDDREFGEARLLDLLVKYRDLELEEILRAVLAEIERWSGGGPPHDDITLVLARAR
jgi:serine phosphatase RsbU (regulator of sigma subunit)